MGSDRETSSDFQLIAGTRDLRVDVAQGRFREDLYARINLWSYALPGLAQRPEDIEPNVDHLLMRSAEETGAVVASCRGADALPEIRQVGRGQMDRQLPRPVGQRDTAGDAGRRRTYSGGTGGSRDPAPALAGQRGAPPATAAAKSALTPCCPTARPTRWTCSTACSWKPSSACGSRTRCPRRAASSMTARAPSARWSTTPTGCASTC